MLSQMLAQQQGAQQGYYQQKGLNQQGQMFGEQQRSNFQNMLIGGLMGAGGSALGGFM
jgi:hypothetical protein